MMALGIKVIVTEMGKMPEAIVEHDLEGKMKIAEFCGLIS